MIENSAQGGGMTPRMLYLLGELKRQMNGAVVGAMRYYGADYGLNYGVTISTIREMGRAQTPEHRFAKYLYAQHIRELKLLALWFAQPEEINTPAELNFWAEGIINSEIAQEAAFVLLHKVEGVESWLQSESEMLQYCSLMALSWRPDLDITPIRERLVELLASEPKLLPKGIVALLGGALRGANRDSVSQFLGVLPHNRAGEFIRDEVEWQI